MTEQLQLCQTHFVFIPSSTRARGRGERWDTKARYLGLEEEKDGIRGSNVWKWRRTGYRVQISGIGSGKSWDTGFKCLELEVDEEGIQGLNVRDWKWRRREFRVQMSGIGSAEKRDTGFKCLGLEVERGQRVQMSGSGEGGNSGFKCLGPERGCVCVTATGIQPGIPLF